MRRSARPMSRCRRAWPLMRSSHDEARLYELIWTRTIASQMESAELERTTVDILADARRAASSICAPPAR